MRKIFVASLALIALSAHPSRAVPMQMVLNGTVWSSGNTFSPTFPKWPAA